MHYLLLATCPEKLFHSSAAVCMRVQCTICIFYLDQPPSAASMRLHCSLCLSCVAACFMIWIIRFVSAGHSTARYPMSHDEDTSGLRWWLLVLGQKINKNVQRAALVSLAAFNSISWSWKRVVSLCMRALFAYSARATLVLLASLVLRRTVARVEILGGWMLSANSALSPILTFAMCFTLSES